MELTDDELRSLIRSFAWKLAMWAENKEVGTPELIKSTVDRMKVWADALESGDIVVAR